MAKVLERSLYQTDYAWTKDQAAKLRAPAAAGVSRTRAAGGEMRKQLTELAAS